MTRSTEQNRAIEWLSLYEGGSTLALHDVDGAVWVDSDTGTTWVVYQEGRVVRQPDGWATDATELEHRVMCPSDFTTDEDYEPFDVPVAEIPGDVTDFHSDRLAEMREERQKVDDDIRYFRERGEAV